MIYHSDLFYFWSVDTFLNDLGRRSLLRSYTNRDICIVYISSNFCIWLDLNNGSVWLRYHTLLIVRMAIFCRVIIFFNCH